MSSVATQKKRLDYIDLAKCFGMLAIIWGHIIHEGWPNQIVYSWHIPLFFFMSGMVFNASKYPTLKSFLSNRVRTLLVPYLVFSVATWLFWVAMRVLQHDSTDYWYPLMQTFVAQGSAGFLRHNLPLWFVTCLFVVEFLYYLINRLPRWAAVGCCVIAAIIGDRMVGGVIWLLSDCFLGT